MCPPNFPFQQIILNGKNDEVIITGLDKPTCQCFTGFRLSKPSGEAVAIFLYDFAATEDKDLKRKILQDMRAYLCKAEKEL